MMASFLCRAAPLAPLATYIITPNTDHYVNFNRNLFRQNNIIHCMEQESRAPSLEPSRPGHQAGSL